MSKKRKVPKTNKFTVDSSLVKRSCFLIVDMVEKGQSEKTIPNKKKKKNKESCRRDKNRDE